MTNYFDISIEEQEMAVRNSYTILQDDILCCNRLSNPTPHQVKYSIQYAAQMAQQHGLRKYMVNAINSAPPDAENRQKIRSEIDLVLSVFDVFVIVVGEATAIQINAQFIFHNHKVTTELPFKIVGTEAEAIEFCNQIA